MRVYLAGPMSGLEFLNFPLFHSEAARLRALGYDVVNPAEINIDPAADWGECMRRDIPELLTCKAIALLDGWENSKGARLEWYIAEALDMKIMFARDIKAAA